jgi:hypothetical protein
MESTPIRIHEITATDWQPKLGELGGVVEGPADVDQCIRIILTTPKGSVPGRPEFGSDLWRYLGLPIDAARPQVVRETVDVVMRWEPRVEITRVVLGLSTGASGWEVHVHRRLRAPGGEAGITRVEVAT